MTYAYKSAPAHGLKLADSGDIEVAFAQFDVIDHDGDVTRRGAFPAKDVPISAYGHTSWDGALPVGRGTISEDGQWAVLKGQLFMDTTHGRDAHATLKGLGDLAEFSYGYQVLDSGPVQIDGRSVRELRKLDPFEVSPVLKGAGIATHLRSIKSGAPGPDAPYAEQLSWYSDGLPALLERVKSRAAVRAEENRKLTRADRARLEDIRDALTGHLDVIAGLLVVPEDPKARAQRRLDIDHLLGEAAALGVPV